MLNLISIGHCVILPLSYIGGPCYMNQCFQDVIALARHYHGFDLFIMFTSNLSWEAITQELLPSQAAIDHPNLVVRVFHIYKTALLYDITDRHIFGDIHAQVHSIECQKRGLPHMHLLLSLFPCHMPLIAAHIDSLIQAS